MMEAKLYDCIIIGGGLAGLCLSIQLSKQGYHVLLLEKNAYPFHKVCGEYISMESWDYLNRLGIDLASLQVPLIKDLKITSHEGFEVSTALDMGGFGISRFDLDHRLASIAKQSGVQLLENTKVTDVSLENGVHIVTTNREEHQGKIVCGSYGKLTPAFMNQIRSRQSGYIGVKYHVQVPFNKSSIELHNFKDGYCGISMVGENTCCMCYLTTVDNLKMHGNDVKQMEKEVLMKNPRLAYYFSHAKFLYDKPLVISQIGFQKKSCYANDVFLLGDAAGAIAPLCGNGMSMAMRASFLLAKHIPQYLDQEITKEVLIQNYTSDWNKHFSTRIKAGYYLQKLFGKRLTTLLALKLMKNNPNLLRKIISLTHGEKF